MTGSNIGIGEDMSLTKRRTRVLDMDLRGQGRVSKYKKDTGELVEHTPWVKNTMTQEGIDNFLLCLKGDLTGHGLLTAANAYICVNSTATTPAIAGVYKDLGADAGPTVGAANNTKSAPAQTCLWEWHDDTVNTYSSADYLHFGYLDFVDGSAGTEYPISTVLISAGNKPNDENWHYQFFLELYSTDTDFKDAGLAVCLDLYNGNDTSNYLNATGITLQPTDVSGGGADVGAALAPDATAAWGGTGVYTLTWVWTVADGTSNGVWAGTEIKIGASNASALRWGGCKTDGTSCGTKAAGEEWEYTYVLTLGQGS